MRGLMMGVGASNRYAAVGNRDVPAGEFFYGQLPTFPALKNQRSVFDVGKRQLARITDDGTTKPRHCLSQCHIEMP